MTALGKGSPARSAFSKLSLSRTGVEAEVAAIRGGKVAKESTRLSPMGKRPSEIKQHNAIYVIEIISHVATHPRLYTCSSYLFTKAEQ